MRRRRKEGGGGEKGKICLPVSSDLHPFIAEGRIEVGEKEEEKRRRGTL